MADQKRNNQNLNDVVDGFSDTHGKSQSDFPNEPDPGPNKNAPKPMSPEEYEKAKQEARKETTSKKFS